MIRGVLFDIGGVFVTDGPDVAAVAETLGYGAGDVDRVGRAVLDRRDEYDLGITERTYWDLVMGDLGGPPLDDHRIGVLRAADQHRWSTHRPDAVALAAEVAATGCAIGILSNAPAPLARAFASVEWVRRSAGSLTFSCDTLVAKPDVRAYAAALAAMDLPAESVAFFDDRPRNVDAAVAQGLIGLLWTGADAARTDLVRLGLLGN